MARMRIPAAQVRRGDQFVVPAELFATGNERLAGGVTLTVQDVEAVGEGLVVLHTDRTPLAYRLDEWIYIQRGKQWSDIEQLKKLREPFPPECGDGDGVRGVARR